MRPRIFALKYPEKNQSFGFSFLLFESDISFKNLIVVWSNKNFWGRWVDEFLNSRELFTVLLQFNAIIH